LSAHAAVNATMATAAAARIISLDRIIGVMRG
jgi:hypothetical protein